MTVAWDDFNFAGADQSVRHDFVEGEIVGAGLQVVDNDNGTEEDPKTWKWVLGGQSDIFGNASSSVTSSSSRSTRKTCRPPSRMIAGATSKLRLHANLMFGM